MFKALFFFLLGMAAGAYAMFYYQQPSVAPGTSLTAKTRATSNDLATKTRDSAERMKDSVSDKLVEWHLTSDDIKADLAKTGEVVRTKAAAVGDRIGDARVVAVVKAKYVLDRDLSALDINIDCRDGEVTLHGTVATPELVGRATALALDTDGVHRVTSKLKVKIRVA